MFLWNARSIVNKLGPFQSYIYSKQFNIIALTETWCHPDISDREILPENYTVYRNDRDSRGGGVLLAISDTICSEQIESPTHSECLLVKLHTHKPIILCVVYVPPSPDPAYLSILLDYIRPFASRSETIVLGDFNCPDVNWASLTAASSPSRLLCDFVFDCDMCQLVESPTHEKGNILDLLLVHSSDYVSNLTVHTDWSVFPFSSDHYPLTSTLLSKANLTNYSSPMTFQFHKGDYVGLQDYLLDVDFSFFFESLDIEFLWENLKNLILDACRKFIPIASCSNRYPQWFNGNIRHKLNIARSLPKKGKKQPSVVTSSTLQRLEMDLQRDILNAKKEFESDLVHKFAFDNNPRLFQYIKKSLKEQSLPQILYLGPSSETSDFGKASLFNQYFHSVFSTSRPPLDPLTLPPPDSVMSLMCDLENSMQDVFLQLSSLTAGKASGIDNIPTIVLKSCATALCGPIHHLFLQCISQAYIPQEWKTHYITPIFKSGDKACVKNYRPISLLPILSKVLERIVFDQVYEHIASLTICSRQFGFLRGRSTVQQLLVHLDSLINSISDGFQSDVVYLDIKKAFDSVSHDILLAKLWQAGICGQTWKFFSTYLYGRLQCVHVGNSTSTLLPVTSGVPQGSILGPLLFIL